MKYLNYKLKFLLFFLLIICGTALHAEPKPKLRELAASLKASEQQGATKTDIGTRATVFWTSNFKDLKSVITPESNPSELQDIVDKYDRTSGLTQPQENAILPLWKEIEAGGTITGVGVVSGDPEGLLDALKGAFAVAIASGNGRSATSLLSVISQNKRPTSLDLLVFRFFVESPFGDNAFKLTDEQRKYSPSDFERLAQLAKHPNPVARLIAVEMLQYILNAKEDATPELAAMMSGMKREDNPAIIKRIIERANRQRSKVYEQILPELSRRVETSNPKLKDEAQRVIKAIEETPANP